MKHLMVLLLTSLLLTSGIVEENRISIHKACSVKRLSPSEKIDYLEQKREYEKQAMYNGCIEQLKIREGFNSGRQYRCPAGLRTIGYGHVIKRGEKFAYRISLEEADSLLREDFNRTIELVDYYTERELKYNELLALSMFAYNLGIGAYNRSTLKKLVEQNKEIRYYIVAYCKVKGKRNKWIRKARIWEYNLYKGDTK